MVEKYVTRKKKKNDPKILATMYQLQYLRAGK
jgi:hypothetical protein